MTTQRQVSARKPVQRCFSKIARHATARKAKEYPAHSRRSPAIRLSPAIRTKSSASLSVACTAASQVNGQTYNGIMPAWKGTLSNKDIAAVITYIRSGLTGNHASAVTESDVTSHK